MWNRCCSPWRRLWGVAKLHSSASTGARGLAAAAAPFQQQQSAPPPAARVRDLESVSGEATTPDDAVRSRRRKPRTRRTAAAADQPASGIAKSGAFIGVLREGPGAVLWEAVVVVDGREISGGEYDTEEEAAKAYDALARMYLGSDAPTNFPLDPYTSWVPPDEVASTGQIETRPGVMLTLTEIVEALKQERGIDVKTVDLTGKSDLASHLVFVTGKSVPHMRKMADMVSRALRKRRLPGVDATVEAREMDDWMVVDAGNIIVNVMDAEAREVFDLENFYTNMKIGQDPYEGLSYEEWLTLNPVPEKWVKRLERDEAELTLVKSSSLSR